MLVTFPSRKSGNGKLTAASFLSNFSFQIYEKKTSRPCTRYSEVPISNEASTDHHSHLHHPGLLNRFCSGENKSVPKKRGDEKGNKRHSACKLLQVPV